MRYCCCLQSPLAAGFKGEEEESRVLSEPDATSGMTELTPDKDGSGRKSNEEVLGEASQLSRS
jgi:hypothetical protein